MQLQLMNTLLSARMQRLTSTLKTAFVVTTIRAICCAETPTTRAYPTGIDLGHKTDGKQCSTKHLPKLGDVCVWKPPTRFCRPAWCHIEMPEAHFCKRCYTTDEELLKDPDCVVDDLKEIFDNKKAYIIDVRRLDELQETGKIPGAVHIPRKLRQRSKI